MIHLLAKHAAARLALIDATADVRLTYGQLSEAVTQAAAVLSRTSERSLVFLATPSSAAGVVAYLACLQAKFPVCLLEPDSFQTAGEGPCPAQRLLDAYRPGLLLLPTTLAAPAGYVEAGSWSNIALRLWQREARVDAPLHADLALLLTTSGSTGDPKLVRLSERNLVANAQSIGAYLTLTPEEVAVQSLPMTYSYGLSIINSHLAAGATIVFPRGSFLRPEFWADFSQHGCTSFAGVPFMYETLARLRFDPARYPTLKTMTQAGGPLSTTLVQQFHAKCQHAGARLFVMYGQTEATARISYLPPDRLAEKLGSIGVAIPGGSLALEPVGADVPYAELVYRGPNVMLGYATTLGCLSLGDELQGVLRTGDLGRMDADGCFYIEGRLKRFAKLLGRRINLVDVEQCVEEHFPVQAAALDAGEQLSVLLEATAGAAPAPQAVQQHLCQLLGVPPKLIHVEAIERLPRTSSGKKDYRTLAR